MTFKTLPALLSLSVLSPLFAISNANAEVQSRIVGGQETGTGYEWMARILTTYPRQGTFACGATLIDKEWLLTAAHCVQKDGVEAKAGDLQIGLGIYNQHDIRYSALKASKVIVHPNYSRRGIRNDIALIKLSKPVSNDPVKLVTQAEYEVLESDAAQSGRFGRTPLTAMGWGRLDSDKGSPTYLQSVEMRKIADRYCGGEEGNYFCADHPRYINNVCSGDSGGPLLTRSTGWVQIGINSFVTGGGVKCSNSPRNGFASIAKLRSFIELHVPSVKESQVPDTNTPDTNTPDTNTPDTNTPDTNTPDTNTPDTSGPGVSFPGQSPDVDGNGTDQGSGSEGNSAGGSLGLSLMLGLLMLTRRRVA